MKSEIGKIAEALGGKKPKSTSPTKKSLRTRAMIVLKKIAGLYNTSPLQTKLTKLAHFLFITAVILVIVVFATARFNISADVALYAISLALAIIPESLIAVVTITMAKGVTHMARRNAIVRRLDAIEALGGVTDICSDKTGTLTMGKMVVRKVWNGRGIWNCEGGDLSLTELSMVNIADKTGDVNDLVRCAALCNGAMVTKKAQKWDVTGEPTEVSSPEMKTDLDRIAIVCCKIWLFQV
jgi:P-type E1-E2 ATPase